MSSMFCCDFHVLTFILFGVPLTNNQSCNPDKESGFCQIEENFFNPGSSVFSHDRTAEQILTRLATLFLCHNILWNIFFVSVYIYLFSWPMLMWLLANNEPVYLTLKPRKWADSLPAVSLCLHLAQRPKTVAHLSSQQDSGRSPSLDHSLLRWHSHISLCSPVHMTPPNNSKNTADKATKINLSIHTLY